MGPGSVATHANAPSVRHPATNGSRARALVRSYVKPKQAATITARTSTKPFHPAKLYMAANATWPPHCWSVQAVPAMVEVKESCRRIAPVSSMI